MVLESFVGADGVEQLSPFVPLRLEVKVLSNSLHCFGVVAVGAVIAGSVRVISMVSAVVGDVQTCVE